MTLTERQKQILDSIIGEYINSAQPVSSHLIEKRYDFGICPATIRIEMQKLTDTGYLRQPHTSAGRVPTDKGYRFFVDNLFEKGIEDFENIFEIEKLFKEEKENIARFIRRLTKFLALSSSEMAVVYLSDKDLFWKEGWEEVVLKPEFTEKNLVHQFASLLENFEEKMNYHALQGGVSLREIAFGGFVPCRKRRGIPAAETENLKMNSGIEICIGKENPFPQARDFSIISSKGFIADEQEAIFALLGPKRMDYDRNIGLLNSLTKFLENF